MTDERLKIAELYSSLQGEGTHAGLPCFFIRTAGCDLRCSWCDTPDALEASAGTWRTLEELVAAVPEHVGLVQITGGEPLLQAGRVFALAEILARPPYSKKVLLETGGHRSLKDVPDFVHIVMDVKLPGSGEDRHDFAANVAYLKPDDEVKFVVAGRDDFDAALVFARQHRLYERCNVLFSPVSGRVELADLAAWIMESRVPARLQTQLHKLIWGATATGV